MARFLSARDLKPDVASGQLSKRQVRNDSGVDIAEGEVVVVTGVYQNLYLAVEKADADSTTTLEGTLFIADMPIKNGTFGTAVAWKLLTGVNTSGASLNDPVYVSSTAGGWSLSGGGTSRRIGSVVTVDASDGVVLLAPGDEVPSEGQISTVAATVARTDAEIKAVIEGDATLDLDAGATIGGSGIVSDADLALVALDGLADVSVATPSDQDVLTWDDGTSTWVAQAAAGGGGYNGDVATSIELTRTTATSTGADSIVIGNDASATGFNSIVIGHDATSDQDECVVIGGTAKSEATGYRHTVIGHGSRADSQGSSSAFAHIAIGYNTEADAFRRGATAIGYAADALGSGSNYSRVAIGGIAVASDTACVAIGESADATADNAVAIGRDAQGTANYAVAIGAEARSTVANAVSLGYDAEATQADAVAIGALSRASRTSTVVLNATGAASAPLTRDSTRINGLYHVVNLKASSPDATPVEATSDGAAASTGDDENRNVVVLADGKVASFRLHMTAIQATTNDAAVYIVTGGVKCLAGTASIIGANTTTAYEDDAGWDCAVTCTSNRLVVTCTADAGGASTWRGTLTLTYEG